MRIKRKRLADTLQLLDQNRQSQPGVATILGHEYETSPEVFSPAHFLDTEAFARAIRGLVSPGMHFLEIGPGSGVISIEAAMAGAKVTAVDINPAAVELTRRNAERLETRVHVLQGNLYDPLRSGETFDSIFWNTPFAWVPEDTSLPILDRAVADPGYAATERFIREGRDYLAPGGRLWIGFSPELGHVGLLKILLKRHEYRFKKIVKAWSKEVRPVRFEIFEAQPY